MFNYSDFLETKIFTLQKELDFQKELVFRKEQEALREETHSIKKDCYSCGKKAKLFYYIEVAISETDDGRKRLFLPNQIVRDKKDGWNPKDYISEIGFCRECMRKIEDNFRATIDYLKKESEPYE